MVEHLEARLIWERVSDYQNKGNGHSTASEPQVLLWHERHGYALGYVMRFGDEVITVAAGCTGFTFTHFAELESPADLINPHANY